MGELILLSDVWLTRRVRDKTYADEEGGISTDVRGYFSGHTPRPLCEQTDVLRKYFPRAGYANFSLVENVPLPEGAEGWFAIPRWERIAPTYCGAVEKVFRMLLRERAGNFRNSGERALTSLNLRESEKTRHAFVDIEHAQAGCGILIVPAQFGMRHRYRSVRRARAIMPEREFGLGAFAVGVMLLTHPARLADYRDLGIECAGDEVGVNPPGTPTLGEFNDADPGLPCVPHFRFLYNALEFGVGNTDIVSPHAGSASAFRL